MEGKTALVAGATGLVGKEVVSQLINDDRYQKIIVLSRRPLTVEYPKLEVKLIDFNYLDKVELTGKIDDCFCALGTTTKKSGREGLIKVDRNYVVELAMLCKKNHVEKFLVVSSQMADARSGNYYLRTKGQMEEAVVQIGFPATYILRPSLLVGNREEFRLTETMGYYVYKALTPLMVGKLYKFRSVSVVKVARCMVELAQHPDTGFYMVESDAIQIY